MTDLNLDGLTDAQLRLFAVRCARRVQHLMTDPRSLAALDVAERHARGEATDEELEEARTAASAAARAAARDAAWAAAAAAMEAERAEIERLREEVTLAERLASGRLAMVEQLTEEVVSLTATRDRQSAMLRRFEQREAELDAEIGLLRRENERLREQIKDCDATIEALQSAVARAAQRLEKK